MTDSLERTQRRLARIGLPLGAATCVVMLLLDPPGGLPLAGWRVAAVAALMAIWWMTEALPLAATALVPLVIFPLLGIADIGETAAPYANPVIFLFLGGFIIAAALEECGLHRRVAVAVVRLSGTSPRGLVAGFMAATAMLSMWVSNTATVVMMLPMALAVIAWQEEQADAPRDFAPALLLGTAYAASIGGIGTLIGTPPNALLAGFMAETYGIRLGFVEWMLFGVPVVLLTLPLTWLILTRVTFRLPAGTTGHSPLPAGGGRLTRVEWLVGAVTAVTAIGWLARPLIARVVPGISDAGIAIAGALLLFLVPAGSAGTRAITWDRVERLPWGVLVLFGGGLTLADAIQGSGFAGWLGDEMRGLQAWPLVLVTAAMSALVIYLSEVASNTSTAAVFLPVAGSVAVSLGAPPLVLASAAAVAASTAFMLPVGTPPNAIIYGSRRVTIGQMARAGFLIDLMFVVVVPAAALWLVPRIFDAG